MYAIRSYYERSNFCVRVDIDLVLIRQALDLHVSYPFIAETRQQWFGSQHDIVENGNFVGQRDVWALPAELAQGTNPVPYRSESYNFV